VRAFYRTLPLDTIWEIVGETYSSRFRSSAFGILHTLQQAATTAALGSHYSIACQKIFFNITKVLGCLQLLHASTSIGHHAQLLSLIASSSLYLE
jgi:hypothetical protein